MKKRIISTSPDLKIMITDTDNVFSVTGMTGSQCGPIHDVIIDNYPHLKPIIKLHHCNSLTGEPRLYVSSVHYFSGLTEFKDHKGTPLPSKRLISEALNTDESTAQLLLEAIFKLRDKKKGKTPGTDEYEKEIKKFVKKNLSKEWKDNAKKAREVFKEIVDIAPTKKQ